MKKLLLISFLIPSISFASVQGIGEYFYGPETSENMACSFAEEKAKENALQKYVGEIIESNLKEICTGENCDFFRETHNTIVGKITNIKNKRVEKTIEDGAKLCTVIIDAKIEILKNNTKIEVKFFRPVVKENEELTFDVIVNKPGNLVIFNRYEEKYYRLYETKIDVVNKSHSVPNKGTIVPVLDSGKFQSVESLVFLFFSIDKKVKDKYNEFEMKNFIGSIPIENRDLVYRYVQIVR